MTTKNNAQPVFSKQFQITGHQGPIYALAQDTQFIYSASADKFVARWHKESGEQDQLAIRCTQTPFSLLVEPSSKQLVLGLSDGHIHVIDTQNKQEIKNLKVHQSAVFALAFNAQQQQYYSADAEGNLIVWDSAWNLLLTLPLGCGKIRQILVVSDGSAVFIAGADGYYRKFETTFFNEVLQVYAHQDGCTALCLLPNGDVLSGGKDAYIRRWTADGTKLAAFPAHLGTIYQLLLLPNNCFVSASRDKSIKIWSQTNNEIIQKLDLQMAGHRHSINALVSHDEGFASAGDDKRIILWQPLN
jgi:WD40 repeat protein